MTAARLAGWLLAAALAAAAWWALRRRARVEAQHARRGEPQGPWRRAVARLDGQRAALGALGVLMFVAALTLLAPLVAPYDPARQIDIVAAAGLEPSAAHPFGTDQFSRDVLSRVLFGGRVSLSVALLSVSVALTVGTAYGAAAGWAGGRIDGAMMRLVDAALAIPRILMLIVVFSLWRGAGVGALVLVLGLTGWFGMARVVRGEVRALRTRDFVTAATALGAPGARVLVRHVLPNVASQIAVAATLAVGNVIVLEAGLSYLGIGVQPPQPSWGSIIFEGREVFRSLWWISAFPGLAIVGTVMALNAAGDGLRDALDPRQG